MATVDAAAWMTFADRFSREHDGWTAWLQVRDAAGGIEYAIEDVPFHGLTLEKRDRSESMVLTFGDDPGAHILHTVDRPADLAYLADQPGEALLVIGRADGSACLLELDNPFTPD